MGEKLIKKYPIKGFREGLLIKLGEETWEEILTNLGLQIDEQSKFFEGAKLAIDVEERSLKAAQIGKLRNLLSERGITLFALLGHSEKTQSIAESYGLLTERTLFTQVKAKEIASNLSGGEEAILIKGNLRSGNAISHPGNVIVDGDVNPGAEIHAGKSIYVWGNLRGTAHAGTNGAEEAIICAMNFVTPRLRIANITYKHDFNLRKLINLPQKALIEKGEITITTWTKKKRK